MITKFDTSGLIWVFHDTYSLQYHWVSNIKFRAPVKENRFIYTFSTEYDRWKSKKILIAQEINSLCLKCDFF